ncbi:YegP family protein [Alloalcanivorax xenomutans]|jgi:uncharacterized protein|uniref:YegP family protein n=1 Tax=Alloalcanivorax xenomutans TaxID=1094342 RepID=A0A9Q3ZEJ6_9GAMM|nr:YegP family protein [Alloalcanivorax xenomutans]ERS13975.1 hypothetical protein Q668_11555 [Alcanivorax sp. PN-3]KYZ87878.1 hypothetical protein A3Q32_00140 [Alcanivorax sp. KX64203]MBA4721047.1 YegP family protein [Alcanivorax sp.]ARB45954.1 hypothetical protein P40_11490 [Alloalcanivorax xenomutans]MCE7508606.1 YegP family protein [Alloalcanivorax xenomutans]|tara:strand:+ start:1537 stop:1872 length:336 start_codon:yes stop_codon:yes gene_type:complete
MAGKFELDKASNGQFIFRLKAANGQVILGSEQYTTKEACKNGIESVQTNAAKDERYQRKEAKDGRHYFNLLAGNHQVIGTSQMYKDTGGMENGIDSVKTNAPGAAVDDLTD